MHLKRCARRIAADFSAGRRLRQPAKRNSRAFHLFAALASGAADFVFLDRPYYYGAKKKYLDWIASRQLETGRYDLFHSWSGDCLQSLRVAKRRGIPSLIEIPTWHRDRGKTSRPKIATPSSGKRSWKENLLLERERFLEEYDLADLLVVLSESAADTFRVQGFPEDKLVLPAARRGCGAVHARASDRRFFAPFFPAP